MEGVSGERERPAIAARESLREEHLLVPALERVRIEEGHAFPCHLMRRIYG